MTTRIRVVQAVNSLALAGAERTTSILSMNLDPARYDVHVMVVRDGPLRRPLEDAGIPVHVVGGEFDLRFPLTIMRSARVLRDLAPEVLHTHMIGSDITAGVAGHLAEVPVILTTQHDTHHRGGALALYRRWSGPRLDAAVAISPSVVEYCRRDLHVPQERIHVIENAIDIERFRQSQGDQRRPATFGSIGTLIPLKGHANLIAAFALVAQTDPGARLLIAGQGPLARQLLVRVEDEGIRERVEFRGVTDDIPAFLREVDVLVHPSLQEAFGLAIVEGMAARKPVIASDLPAIRHLLAEGTVGRLVPAGDISALAAAMTELADDPKVAATLGDAGFEHASASYCAARMAHEYGELYASLVAAAALR